MDNNTIAKKFDTLSKVMELYDENPFKIRSYTQAYAVLKKMGRPFSEMTKAELEEIPGVGSAISDKILELVHTGKMKTLETYLEKTPEGIIEMLNIRGFGPKKVKQVWKILGIESLGELIYACNENRIASLNGFGLKTQQYLLISLQYAEESRDKFLFAKAHISGTILLETLMKMYPGEKFVLTGEMSLQLPVVNGIKILSTIEENNIDLEKVGFLKINGQNKYHGIPVSILYTDKEKWTLQKFVNSCSEEFLKKINLSEKKYTTEEEIFEKSGISFIHPARRDDPAFIENSHSLYPVLERSDFKGTIHHHSTYSDGIFTLGEMKSKATELGYEYMVVTDHSQSAVYAKGLSQERIFDQWNEIDILNKNSPGCYLIKGIESDILSGGELDYPEEILKGFQCIIASIHSNFKMDEEKASKRLITAIENPYTKILGHPTGRLLLSRPGYPVNIKYIIDACAANGVAIELNSNPMRLDIDYTHLDYVTKKDVWLCINPDAHSVDAIEHVQYGIFVAQKRNINPDKVLNKLPLPEIMKWLQRH